MKSPDIRCGCLLRDTGPDMSEVSIYWAVRNARLTPVSHVKLSASLYTSSPIFASSQRILHRQLSLQQAHSPLQIYARISFRYPLNVLFYLLYDLLQTLGGREVVVVWLGK